MRKKSRLEDKCSLTLSSTASSKHSFYPYFLGPVSVFFLNRCPTPSERPISSLKKLPSRMRMAESSLGQRTSTRSAHAVARTTMCIFQNRATSALEICISPSQSLACVPSKRMGSKEVVMTSISSQLKILAKNSTNCPTNTCL